MDGIADRLRAPDKIRANEAPFLCRPEKNIVVGNDGIVEIESYAQSGTHYLVLASFRRFNAVRPSQPCSNSEDSAALAVFLMSWTLTERPIVFCIINAR